ncbi:unnamed protein product [Phaedon cochleariae]|uniref:Uncharacterized protein n=1 Tax=Phaedon cochleariae TaxID=80249 RepID=A0A9P0DAB9_PHACE|nr:unnamed protein product [Phaedon cochleariae]
MLVDESVQTSRDMERRAFEERVVKEGMELWRKQKDYQKMKRSKEQNEMKDMLELHWPWGEGLDAKPRGLRNLRLEEIFPNNDYKNAKRFVGNFDLGRGGGGAPVFSSGKTITRTREDPILRFQFGSKDLRRCVDNTLRYKTNKEEQQRYKKELDNLVELKQKKQDQEKTDTLKFYREQGWSTDKTLKHLANDAIKSKLADTKRYNNFKSMTVVPPNRVMVDPVVRKNFVPVGRNRKLSPLSDDRDEGVELVALLSKDRKNPAKIPLCSSDVTSEKKMGGITVWDKQGPVYLTDLAEQMIRKRQKVEEMQVKELASIRKHFSTWNGFWGRPGHGAPLPEIRKQCLNEMLYPKMAPIGVH